jgi:hypothetical protein
MPDDTLSDSDSCYLALHAEGWMIGDMAVRDNKSGAVTWMVSGMRGHRQIRAEGASKDEAWKEAWYEAMLGTGSSVGS